MISQKFQQKMRHMAYQVRLHLGILHLVKDYQMVVQIKNGYH